MEYYSISSDSDDSDAIHCTPRRRRQSVVQSNSRSRTRRPISPPPLSRQATGSQDEQRPLPAAAATPRSNRGSFQKTGSGLESLKDDGRRPSVHVRPGSSTRTNITQTSSFAQDQQEFRTPKNQTPKKGDWTVEKIEQALREFEDDISRDGARLAARHIHTAWKRGAPEYRFISKKNWLADLKQPPAEGPKPGSKKDPELMKIKTKVGRRVFFDCRRCNCRSSNGATNPLRST